MPGRKALGHRVRSGRLHTVHPSARCPLLDCSGNTGNEAATPDGYYDRVKRLGLLEEFDAYSRRT
jgi:hypothetical protein